MEECLNVSAPTQASKACHNIPVPLEQGDSGQLSDTALTKEQTWMTTCQRVATNATQRPLRVVLLVVVNPPPPPAKKKTL